MKKIITFLNTIFLCGSLTAQVSIGLAEPDNSAVLEIQNNSKGLLIPRVALMGINDAQSISNPANSLMVYNTQNANGLRPGYYYWNKTAAYWVQLLDSYSTNSNWSLLGNAGTLAGVNFIGTKNNADLQFRQSNSIAGLLNAGSQLTSFGVNGYRGNIGSSFNALRNTAIGYRSLQGNSLATVRGSDNTALGAFALAVNSSGHRNTGLGSSALKALLAGNDNVAIGQEALASLDYHDNNTALGAYALASNLQTSNVAIGAGALTTNKNGAENAALGTNSLTANTIGVFNTAMGSAALEKNTTGIYNTAIGSQALKNHVSGAGNTAVGYLAGPTTSNLRNTSSIGYDATATGDNRIRLGNNSIQHISGNVGFSVNSDARYKEQINSIPFGLYFLNLLRPVDYLRENNQERTKEWGLIAQEVQVALASLTYHETNLVDTDGTEANMLMIRYTELLAPILYALQELAAQNKELEAEIETRKVLADGFESELLEIDRHIKELTENRS